MKSLDCFRLLLVDNEQFDDSVASLPLIMRMCNTIELLLSRSFGGLSRFLNVKRLKLSQIVPEKRLNARKCDLPPRQSTCIILPVVASLPYFALPQPTGWILVGAGAEGNHDSYEFRLPNFGGLRLSLENIHAEQSFPFRAFSTYFAIQKTESTPRCRTLADGPIRRSKELY
jgi:hypothetical protein